MLTSLLSTVALAALVAADTTPPALHDLEALLAKPVSPGVIALLLPHLRDERAARTVMESLAHPAAAVRATAARVVSVAGMAAAGPRVRRALDSETEPSAAGEQLRAAVALAPPGDDLSLLAAARKHGLVRLLAETIGRARGKAALPLLDPLHEAGLPEEQERDFIAFTTRHGQEMLNVVGSAALRTGNVTRWSAVLSLAHEPRAAFAPGLVLAAIGSPKPEFRESVYWHLALNLAKDVPLSPEIEAAIAATPEAVSPESANANAAFALVVLRRAQQGRNFGGDWGERAAQGNPTLPHVDTRGWPAQIGRFLTKGETIALSRRLTRGQSDRMFEPRAEITTLPEDAAGDADEGLLIAGGLPPGTLRDVLAVAGCKPQADLRAVGLVGYRADGRPQHVSAPGAGLSRPCAEAAVPALGMTLAPSDLMDVTKPERRTIVIVPLDKGALECADEPEPSPPRRVQEASSGPATVSEPRKVKNVAPVYPLQAKVARREGAVILEAVIAKTGCIRSVRVIRGVAPDLDAAALIAVGQWRYTPTVFDGNPVPVIMTVTINFRLS